ncbi:N4BP2 family protein [Megaselia abdita]
MSSFKTENIVARLSEVFPDIPEFLIKNFCQEVNNDENECTSKCIEYLEKKESSSNSSVKVQVKESPPVAMASTVKPPFPHHIQPCTMSYHANIEELLSTIRNGTKVLVLMRGVPGCGKSYLSKEILKYTMSEDVNPRDHIFSADDYFYDARGRYIYDRNKLSLAHEDTQKRVKEKAVQGWSPLIVDNTHVKLWEMSVYVQYAVQNGYFVEVVQPMTPWCKSEFKLAQKNSHGVPRDRIAFMLEGFEHGTSRDLICMLKETKYSDPPPQQRTHPPIPIPFVVMPKKSTPSPSYPEERKKPKITESPIRPSTSQNEGTAWLPYEQESSSFWKSNDFPKPVRVKKKTNGSLIDCLKNEKSEAPVPSKENPVLQLDKHSSGCKNENQTFVLLKQIYPNHSSEHLWDLFEKCAGNLDWTVEVLLSDNTVVEIEEKGGLGFQCMCNLKKVTTETDNKFQDWKPSPQPVSQPQPQRVKKDVSELKKTIESQFVLGEEFYSEKLKKIKNKRYGIEEPPEEEKAVPVDFNYNDLPDFDSESNSNETESNEMIEMDLGADLIAQLTQMFETESEILYSQGMPIQKLNSNVFMPKSLAKQLYVIWMESLYNQMEENKQKTLREDEEFARILELPKYANRKAVPSNYSEIMDMELAWQLYYAENDTKTKQNINSPKDLADHLTRMKLCELFPKVDKKTLVEVLVAHNNSFAETVEVLKHSVNINGLDEKMKITKEELLDKVKHENEKMRNTVPDSPMKKIIVKDDRQNMAEDVQRQALRVFEENRNLASHHSQMRAECFQKAKEAHQKCKPGVALYYSQIANLHKSRSEEFNHKAANSIMEVHDIRQNNPDYIDLHYLHTIEAAQCLDIFLDRHISKLRNSTRSYKYVFIITGRGLHSAGGVSTIKMKVKQRLKERKLV